MVHTNPNPSPAAPTVASPAVAVDNGTGALAVSAGVLRLAKDKRQYGSLLMLLSLAAIVYPLNNLSTRIGRDGTTADKGIPLISLISSVFIAFIGMSGLVVGYLTAVHDYGSRLISIGFVAVVQLAWLPYIADMANTGRKADELIHPAYASDTRDDNIVAAMGVLGILGYGMFFLGSIGFLAFGIFGFHSGDFKYFTKGYYRSRLAFYSFFTFVAGFSQLFLGSYLQAEFPVEDGALPIPVATGTYFISLPAIAIFIGCVQIINSFFAAWRAYSARSDPHDHLLQWAFFAQWIFMMVLQVVVQVAFPVGEIGAPATPALAALIVSFNVLPAFLDYKMRTTPEVLVEGYYSVSVQKVVIAKGQENNSMSDEELAA